MARELLFHLKSTLDVGGDKQHIYFCFYKDFRLFYVINYKLKCSFYFYEENPYNCKERMETRMLINKDLIFRRSYTFLIVHLLSIYHF